MNYEIPLDKIPTLNFLKATYSYQGLYQWQKGSDLFGALEADDGNTYDLGNSISNGNTHNINSTLDMNKLYKYLGIKKKRASKNSGKVSRTAQAGPPSGLEGKGKENDKKKGNTTNKGSGVGTGLANFGIGVITSVKRIQVNYSENNGTFLPGYTDTPGFIGTSKPTLGYTLGSRE
nr:hypothetical protein [Lacinutrix neustonica]